MDGEKSIEPLPAAVEPPALSERERTAERLIYSEILRMQEHESYRHLEFAHEKIDPRKPSDQLFAYRVLSAIGPDNVEQFLRRVWVQFEKFDVNALAKSPGRSSGAPRSLGLIWEWAKRYAGQIAEAARIDRAEAERWKARQVARALQILSDPTESDYWKQEARKIVEAAENSAAQAS